MECKFLSNPEFEKSVGHYRCFPSYQNDEVQKSLEKPVEHKLTCLFEMTNGTEVSGGKIGAGRFGTVFVGAVTNSTLKVAIKEYHPSLRKFVRDSDGEKSILHKITSIQHPCIMQTFSVSQFSEIVYRVMEFRTRTLQDDIFDKGKYEDDQIKLVLIQVTRALEYLHAQNLCHGTLHTRNIFIENDMVKVSDIESTQFFKGVSISKTPSRILPFIAPELYCQLSEVTKECDLWGLGVCLFVMATGFLPFNAESRSLMKRNIQAGNLCTSVSVSVKIQEFLNGLLCVNPAGRLSLKSMTEDPWISSDKIWRYLIPCHEDLMNDLLYSSEPVHLKSGVSTESLVHQKTEGNDSEESIESKDEGYNSVASDVPETNEGIENKKNSEHLQEKLPKKYYKNFAVYAIENVREEWDPEVTRIEKCKLSNGNLCLRIVIPAKDEVESNTIFNRIQNRFGQTIRRFRSHQDTVVDADYGDYALMNFRRETTGMEVAHNMPKFTNKRQVHLYYCKKEAERVWENLDIKICMRCRRAGTDAFIHDEDKCLYKLISEATNSEEVIFYGTEDQFNVRFFSLVYRNDGGRASTLTRLRRGSMRILSSGYQRIVRRLRPQSSSESDNR